MAYYQRRRGLYSHRHVLRSSCGRCARTRTRTRGVTLAHHGRQAPCASCRSPHHSPSPSLSSLSPRWQHLLKNHKLSVFESQYYLAPVGAGFLLVGAAFSETSKAIQMDALGTIASHPSLFAASAVLGVIASMLTFLVIKLTNSVTLKVRVPHGPSNPQ